MVNCWKGLVYLFIFILGSTQVLAIDTGVDGCVQCVDQFGSTNDGCSGYCCLDLDGDGWDGSQNMYFDGSCFLSDCNDNDESVYPGAPELCTTVGTDNDCDGYFNEGACFLSELCCTSASCGSILLGYAQYGECYNPYGCDEPCDSNEDCISNGPGYCQSGYGVTPDCCRYPCTDDGQFDVLWDSSCCSGHACYLPGQGSICEPVGFDCSNIGGLETCSSSGVDNYCDPNNYDLLGYTCGHVYCNDDGTFGYDICPKGQSCQGTGISSGCFPSGNPNSCPGEGGCSNGDSSSECCVSPNSWIDGYTIGYQCCGDDGLTDYGNILSSKVGLTPDTYCNDKTSELSNNPKWFHADIFQGTILSTEDGSFDNVAYNNRWYACDADGDIGQINGDRKGPGGLILGNGELLTITKFEKSHDYLCYIKQNDYEGIAECCGSDFCFDQQFNLGGIHLTNNMQVIGKDNNKFCCNSGVFYNYQYINSNQDACECFGGSYSNGVCTLGLSQEQCQIAEESDDFLSCDAGDISQCASINNHQFAVHNGNCYGNAAQKYNRIIWKDVFSSAANDKLVLSVHALPAEESGKWYDCDSSNLVCQNCDDCSYSGQGNECFSSTNTNDNFPNCIGLECWINSGELNVGEYPDQTTNQCCGDDANEYFIKGKDGTSACCDSATKVVVESKCIVDCPLNTAHFSYTEVSENSSVEFIVNGTFNCMGQKILYQLYEYDFPFHDFGAGNDDIMYEGLAIFDQYGPAVQARLEWNAIVDPLESGDSEYYFIASLGIAPDENISSPDYTDDLIVHPAVPNPCDDAGCQNDDGLCCPACNILNDNDCPCENVCNADDACSSNWISSTDRCCETFCVPEICIELYAEFCTIDEWGSCKNGVSNRDASCTDETSLAEAGCPLPAKEKPCIEQAFPFFTGFNLIIVSIILLSFYAFQLGNGKKYI